MCTLRVFWVNNKVAVSGDVMIQKLGFSIVDTHEPAVSMPLSSFCIHMEWSSYKNQIFLEGRHQEVRRFVSPGLHHITSVMVIAGCRAMKTYVDSEFVWLVSSKPGDD